MLCPKDNVLQQAWYLLLPLLIQRDNCRVSPLVRTTHKSCCCVLQSLAVLTLPLVRLLNHSNWCSIIHAHLHPSFFWKVEYASSFGPCDESDNNHKTSLSHIAS